MLFIHLVKILLETIFAFVITDLGVICAQILTSVLITVIIATVTRPVPTISDRIHANVTKNFSETESSACNQTIPMRIPTNPVLLVIPIFSSSLRTVKRFALVIMAK